MKKALLAILALSSLLTLYSDDLTEIELIIVSKTPRGAYAEINEWDEWHIPEFRNLGWYDIGLSRNGKEPVEYIWYANNDANSFAIMKAKIGDKGTVYLQDWGRRYGFELPQPDTENPPVIGMLGEVYWEGRR